MILQDLYKVDKTTTKDAIQTTSLLFNKDHEIYKGHFPGRPVTPGVVLMNLFKDQAERHTGKSLQLVRANNVKFVSVFDPSNDPELSLESEIELSGEFVKLKGIAKKGVDIVLKINSLYKII